jgi:uncharacterized protein YlxW (UPF0749 family)
MHRFRNQLTMAAVAFLLGVLVVVQLRTQQAAPGLAGLSAQDLTVLVANLNTRNDQLRKEISGLERELGALATSQSRGETSVDQLRGDLARVRAWAGLEPVFGPGVSVTVDGPLPGPAVEDLLNELRNAGAEAIGIEGIRIVPGTAVAGSDGALSVDGTLLPHPFEIRAIGSSETLTGSLTRVGGPVALVGATYPDVALTVTPLERIDLPPTGRSLIPSHGHPRL